MNTTNISINKNYQVSGHINLKVVDRKTKELTFESDFSNTITDSFFSRGLLYTAGSTVYNASTCYLRLGTDTTPILTTATSLENPTSLINASFGRLDTLTSTSNNFNVVEGPTLDQDYIEFRFGATSSIGDWVGTFSSIGLHAYNSPYDLTAGTLIKDELGNPTTITLTSEQQVIVEYYIRIHRGSDQIYGPFDLNGVTKYIVTSSLRKEDVAVTGTSSIINAFPLSSLRLDVRDLSINIYGDRDSLTIFHNQFSWTETAPPNPIPDIYRVIGGALITNYFNDTVEHTVAATTTDRTITSVRTYPLTTQASRSATVNTSALQGICFTDENGVASPYTLPANHNLKITTTIGVSRYTP